MYLKLLSKFSKELQIKIIAYCIMGNHAHFLLKIEKIENLSKLMQKINSNYARYYNFINERVGYVFKDRFLSEPITSHKYFIQCIKYIHLNPVKANIVKKCEDYEFSSYKHFQELEKRKIDNNLLQKEDYFEIINNNNDSEYKFIDIEKRSDDSIKFGIEKFLKLSNFEAKEIFLKREIIKELVKFLHENEKIKYVDIMKYFEMTKGTIEWIKKYKFM